MFRVLFFLLFPFFAIAQHGTIEVEITGFRNNQGNISFLAFNQSNGFPKDATKAIKKIIMPIQQDKTTILLENMPKGDYAVVFLHDENSNRKADRYMFGIIPKEGFGFSVKQPPFFAEPTFAETKFAHDGKHTLTKIKVTYISL